LVERGKDHEDTFSFSSLSIIKRWGFSIQSISQS